MIAAGNRRAPELVHFRRERARRANADIVRRRIRYGGLHRADYLGVGGQRRPGTRGDVANGVLPGSVELLLRSCQAGSEVQPPSAASSASSASVASASTAAPPHLMASKVAALIDTRRALAYRLCDPVVKSCKRVPTASTTSVSAASSLAARCR